MLPGHALPSFVAFVQTVMTAVRGVHPPFFGHHLRIAFTKWILAGPLAQTYPPSHMTWSPLRAQAGGARGCSAVHEEGPAAQVAVHQLAVHGDHGGLGLALPSEQHISTILTGLCDVEIDAMQAIFQVHVRRRQDYRRHCRCAHCRALHPHFIIIATVAQESPCFIERMDQECVGASIEMLSIVESYKWTPARGLCCKCRGVGVASGPMSCNVCLELWREVAKTALSRIVNCSTHNAYGR
mmetsp:Transcript_16352/g.26285  ORF Transcript_16352/g.26285 Transcript_16352/m.26285 type:complete len:240 (+) Transcript_16352:376-1095(+)